jgi:hypothetical protein
MNEDCKCKENDADDDDGLEYVFILGLVIVSLSIGHIWSTPIGWLFFGSVVLIASFCCMCASASEESTAGPASGAQSQTQDWHRQV